MTLTCTVSEAFKGTFICSDVTKERTQYKILGNEQPSQSQVRVWNQVSVGELPETFVF